MAILAIMLVIALEAPVTLLGTPVQVYMGATQCMDGQDRQNLLKFWEWGEER